MSIDLRSIFHKLYISPYNELSDGAILSLLKDGEIVEFRAKGTFTPIVIVNDLDARCSIHIGRHGYPFDMKATVSEKDTPRGDSAARLQSQNVWSSMHAEWIHNGPIKTAEAHSGMDFFIQMATHASTGIVTYLKQIRGGFIMSYYDEHEILDKIAHIRRDHDIVTNAPLGTFFYEDGMTPKDLKDLHVHIMSVLEQTIADRIAGNVTGAKHRDEKGDIAGRGAEPGGSRGDVKTPVIASGLSLTADRPVKTCGAPTRSGSCKETDLDFSGLCKDHTVMGRSPAGHAAGKSIVGDAAGDIASVKHGESKVQSMNNCLKCGKTLGSSDPMYYCTADVKDGGHCMAVSVVGDPMPCGKPLPKDVKFCPLHAPTVVGPPAL